MFFLSFCLNRDYVLNRHLSFWSFCLNRDHVLNRHLSFWPFCLNRDHVLNRHLSFCPFCLNRDYVLNRHLAFWSFCLKVLFVKDLSAVCHFSGTCSSTAVSSFQKGSAVAISKRSLTVCGLRSVGPRETTSMLGYFSKITEHSSPA